MAKSLSPWRTTISDGKRTPWNVADFAEANFAGIRVVREARVETNQRAARDAEIPAALDAAQGRNEDVNLFTPAVERFGPEIRERPKRLVALREQQPQLIECHQEAAAPRRFVLRVLVKLLQKGLAPGLKRGEIAAQDTIEMASGRRLAGELEIRSMMEVTPHVEALQDAIEFDAIEVVIGITGLGLVERFQLFRDFGLLPAGLRPWAFAARARRGSFLSLGP